MAKASAIKFFCTGCGYESAKWMGQCPACKAWNTFAEAPKESPVIAGTGLSAARHGTAGRFKHPAPVRLEDVEPGEGVRISTGFSELDIVLGGGLVASSLILVGGDPGIGKSTLLLQVCRNLALGGNKVLYVSGEESPAQIRMRADRIGRFSGDISLLADTSLDSISETLIRERPQFAVIDSIQTMYMEEVTGAPGGISQVRESTMALMRLAKGLGITIFIVGHVTKEGTVAGPRMLEHIVDTVLYFEGEKDAPYRIIRGVKNRFGPTNEIGVFEMLPEGLSEVKNPSQMMLDGRADGASGSCITCAIGGSRPVLLEIQALVCRTGFGTPRRTANGMDYNRMNMLMAVLEKRAGLRLSECDAYINLAGGMKVSEPALDLAVVMALASSFKDRPPDPKMLVFGEVGLAGEVRSVTQASRRVAEAAKMGFSSCMIPRSGASKIKVDGDIRLITVGNVGEALKFLLPKG